ncbi:MAG: IS30 family transposase [bacterium]|nr:IS30 family transposase [bacterium]
MNTYKRLNFNDREEISRGLAAGWTFSHIAHNISRPVSTVSREVWSNCQYKRTYRAELADQKSTITRCRQKQSKKLETNVSLLEYVLVKLKTKQWSPEAIANRLVVEYPLDMTMRISHESIYTYIYCLPKGNLKKELISALRQERNLRKKREQSHAKRSNITNAISISERPSETILRTIPGHWEGDLIIGKDHASAMGTLVERVTRYTLLIPLKAKDAYSVRISFSKAIKQLPRHLKSSLTYDRGSEMAEHELFTKDTKVQVYFCDPHSPWQRGTNENTNGLIRQYFPKGTDFNLVTKKEILRVQDLLNDRPRKVLAYAKPDEVFIPLLTSKVLR